MPEQTFGNNPQQPKTETERQKVDIERQQNESNQPGASGREGVASVNPSDYDARSGPGGGNIKGMWNSR